MDFQRPMILDGATGTQLFSRGLPRDVCVETWTLEHPEVITDIQRAYREAGAQLVYAPTFGANRVNLKKHKVSESIESLCRRLTALSRRAVGDACLVAGDIAPTGLLMDPYGETTVEEVEDIFLETAKGLEAAGVDLFGIETQLRADEAAAAIRAVRAVSTKPVIVSFSCTDEGRTFWGEDLTDVVKALEPLGIAAFGINCCGNLDTVRDQLAALSAVTDLPLIAKPNAGFPKLVDGQNVYSMPPEALAAYVPDFLSAGAKLIGGCCGTHEGHIRAIKEALNGLEHK